MVPCTVAALDGEAGSLQCSPRQRWSLVMSESSTWGNATNGQPREEGRGRSSHTSESSLQQGAILVASGPVSSSQRPVCCRRRGRKSHICCAC